MPPIDKFLGEDSTIRFDDWIPSLERAAEWYSKSEEESLMQTAGQLRGKALHEWNRLNCVEKQTYKEAIVNLRSQFGAGARVFAAKNFRHTTQGENESVSAFTQQASWWHTAGMISVKRRNRQCCIASYRRVCLTG